MNKLSDLDIALRKIEELSEDYHKQLDAKNREIEALKKSNNDLLMELGSLRRYCDDLEAINWRLSGKLENIKKANGTKYV